MNFSKVFPNLKMTFSITFRLVLKLRSYLVATTYLAGTGFLLNMPYVEEIPTVVIVEEEVRVTR